VERLLVVGQLVERLVLVGKLLERIELERIELERQQLVGRIMARGELGPEVAGSSR
jgi:hypothetical protein